METTTKHNIEIIEKSLSKSMNYDEYVSLVNHLVETNSTTGNEKTETLANYTMLNARRMKRWNKTVKIDDEAARTFTNIDKPITFLVITESWCGDAAHVVPVINKIAELNKFIKMKLVLRDENDDLIEAFLTNGAKAIPKLIALDNTNNILFTYGPRPSTATQLVKNYKEEHGKLTPEFKEDLQHWYNKDKGQTVIKDITKLV